MSCENADCGEVLAEVYEYLHHELDAERREEVQRHLDDCGDCLRDYGLEEEVQELIRRSCGSPAPAELRTRIMQRITEVRITGPGTTASFVSETTVEVSQISRRSGDSGH